MSTPRTAIKTSSAFSSASSRCLDLLMMFREGRALPTLPSNPRGKRAQHAVLMGRSHLCRTWNVGARDRNAFSTSAGSRTTTRRRWTSASESQRTSCLDCWWRALPAKYQWQPPSCCAPGRHTRPRDHETSKTSPYRSLTNFTEPHTRGRLVLRFLSNRHAEAGPRARGVLDANPQRRHSLQGG